MRRRLIVIGIGGASCSGKTLLAKHLASKVLPKDTTIVHQDDFCPPVEQVPYHSKYPELQDWDEPSTCVVWPEFRSCLQHFRDYGSLPEKHRSHDHLNKQVEVQVDPATAAHWKGEFDRIKAEYAAEGTELIWLLVDGFVMYWDPVIIKCLDVRIMLRVPYDILKRRREERATYILENPDEAAAGDVWEDPPQYFERVVYPAYVKAHEDIFTGGDVEHGKLREEWGPEAKDLRVFPSLEGEEEMTKAFAGACETIIASAREGCGCFPTKYA